MSRCAARLGSFLRRAFVYLTLAGSIIAFAAYSYALRHMDIAVVSLYTYINTVIAVALGAVVLGEPVGWRTLAAAGLIALGVIVVGPGAREAAKPAVPEK